MEIRIFSKLGGDPERVNGIVKDRIVPSNRGIPSERTFSVTHTEDDWKSNLIMGITEDSRLSGQRSHPLAITSAT